MYRVLWEIHLNKIQNDTLVISGKLYCTHEETRPVVNTTVESDYSTLRVEESLHLE